MRPRRTLAAATLIVALIASIAASADDDKFKVKKLKEPTAAQLKIAKGPPSGGTSRDGTKSSSRLILDYFAPLTLDHIAGIPTSADEHFVPPMDAQMTEQRYPGDATDEEIRQETGDRYCCYDSQRL